MGEKKRDFKGVWITKEIWLSKEIGPTDKLIFAEVNSLDNEFGCVAGNEHFMDMFDLSERQVQRILKGLKDKGLIDIEINKVKDTRVMRVVGKYAYISADQIAEIGFLAQQIAQDKSVNKYRRRDS